MAGNTLIYYKGSTFEYAGTITEDGAPVDINTNPLSVYKTDGNGLSDLVISVLDGPSGSYRVSLSDQQALKLPPGRVAWFQLMVTYSTGRKQVFPQVWLEVR